MIIFLLQVGGQVLWGQEDSGLLKDAAQERFGLEDLNSSSPFLAVSLCHQPLDSRQLLRTKMANSATHEGHVVLQVLLDHNCRHPLNLAAWLGTKRGGGK